jgi:hypothetical protein
MVLRDCHHASGAASVYNSADAALGRCGDQPLSEGGHTHKEVGSTGRYEADRRKPLSMRHMKVVDLVVNEGMTYKDAAAALGLSVKTVTTVMNRDEVQKIISDRTMQVLRKASVKAATKLTEQLDSDNPWVVQNAAGRILSMIDQAEQRESDNTITVNFSMNMPKPGMPEAVTDGSDAVIPAEGQVT